MRHHKKWKPGRPVRKKALCLLDSWLAPHYNPSALGE
jgi:hypothetical protein